MKKYRKKPVVVEAVRLTEEADWDLIVKWCDGRIVNTTHGVPGSDPDSLIRISTLEGNMDTYEGDWIIKEPHPTSDRKFYPCKPDIFEATYEEVDKSHKPRKRRMVM